MIKSLMNTIASHGDRGAVVPFSRVDDLKNDMLELKNGEYHTDWLDRMAKHMAGDENRFIPSDTDFTPRALISIVMPNPKVLLQFCYRGNLIHCVVPPHYTNWYQKNDHALRYLKNYLAPHGFSVAIVKTLPQKLLAVHCGLAQFGRNNICYNDEFGSHMQIMSYITDLPCDETQWFPLRRIDKCEKCHACVTSCPTGAIDSTRRLINADRCITAINELPDVEFPEWISKEAHNSVVGCVLCQDCCPGNAHNINNVITGVVFSEEETEELLSNMGDTPYSVPLTAKIEATGIPPEYASARVLPRNLAALINQCPTTN